LSKGKLNRAWHESHVMPSTPTREQRIEWHAAHAEVCGCRPVPRSLEAEVRKFKGRSRGRDN